MSPVLIKQAIGECFDLGLKKELDVSKHLTVMYGGLLMENAVLVEQHWPIEMVSTNTTPRGGGQDTLNSNMLGYPNSTTVTHGNLLQAQNIPTGFTSSTTGASSFGIQPHSSSYPQVGNQPTGGINPTQNHSTTHRTHDISSFLAQPSTTSLGQGPPPQSTFSQFWTITLHVYSTHPLLWPRVYPTAT